MGRARDRCRRILVEEGLVPLLEEQGADLARDDKCRWYLNLWPGFVEITGGKDAQGSLAVDTDWARLEDVRGHISGQLLNAESMKVVKKLRWLADNFDAFIEEQPDSCLEPIRFGQSDT